MVALLAPFDTAALDAEPATVLALGADDTIAYVNPAYWAFAAANDAQWAPGAWGVGASIFAAIPAVLARFYQHLFARARSERAVVEHEYECSSPDAFRRFRLRVLPCADQTLVLSHALVVERHHDEASGQPVDALFRRADGTLLQCSHCRRVRRHAPPSTWDWVPAYVAKPARNVSHGLCGTCATFYYGAEMTGGTDASSATPRRILVVDDDAGLRSVIQRILARRGYEAVSAITGRAALDAIAEGRFDLALIDLHMPGMDGREVALALRAASPSLPVMFMSGADQGDVPAALEASFIAKPFTPGELGAAIERVLGRDDAR